jgi:PAS domain S-box-containing protein
VTKLSGYLLDVVWPDGDFVRYRARRDDADYSPVLVVAPIAEPCGPATLRRLEHEYAFRAELDPAWAVRPLALSRSTERTLLVLEDYGGEPLARLLGQPLELTRFLHLAIGISVALGHVHAKGLIHKDVKPANMLVNAVSGRVWLTGFGIASELPRERQPPEPPQVLAGTLAYMAPEQTGRMNRSIDSRSDLYSLGVTLYEMLTGELPFMAADPMEWVHCHVARQPTPPVQRVPEIPAVVSAIVMKLLAKNPEERYQSAGGVVADLRRCLAALEASGRIDPFPLGAHDASDRLLIPEKLYGRDRASKVLLDAFDRVVESGTPELVLVSGYSGIGKSSVVNELHRVIVLPRGLFATGKFDQLKRDIPYAILAQAFQSLVRQILGQSDADLDTWRSEIREALGSNGQLIVDLVPEITSLIGNQPAVPELAPREAENRFHTVLGRFLAVFAQKQHPCVLFLDDLQWLDAASLKCLEYVLTHPDTRHLLLIGAYRDNEVSPTHPLMRGLETIRKAGAIIHELVVAPLSVDDLAQLIADGVHCEPSRAAPLAQLVHEKTAGNPFFAIQFLTTLAEQHLLVFDASRGAWTWDVERIRRKDITDNVVDLMVEKLKRLPATTQAALKQFACLGNVADAATLRVVLGRADSDTDLSAAVRAEFIQRMGETYRFVHDRIREASYALIPEEQRAATHLRVGRLLAAGLPAEGMSEPVFEVTNQLNAGSALITDPQEKQQLCQLNIRAGRQAKRAGAYASALSYFVRATALLPADAWSEHYEQTFGLYLYRSQCEYLIGNFDHVDELFALLLANARCDLDRAKAYRLRIQLFQVSGRHADAVATAFEALRLFGVSFPDTKEDIRSATVAEQQSMIINLAGRRVTDLVSGPVATDPTIKTIIGLLSDSLTSVYTARSSLLPLVVLKALNLSLRHGNVADSCAVYSFYGFVVLSLHGDIRLGAEFSDMAVRLSQNFDHPKMKGRLLLSQAAFINLWRAHFATSLPILERVFLAAFDVGDLVFAGYTTCFTMWLMLEVGGPLDESLKAARRYTAFARRNHNDVIYQTIRLSEQYVASLKGLTQQPGSFSDAAFDEAATLQGFETAKSGPSITAYHILKLTDACIFGRYDRAQDHALRAATTLREVMCTALEVSFYFYHALTLAALHRQVPQERQQELGSTLKGHLSKLERWAQHCPENFRSRHSLVAAEMERIEGRPMQAMELYEEAIRSARTNGFVQIEALANELAGRFHLERGFETIGRAYLRDARSCYLRWGALGKVGQLESEHPQLAEHPSPPSTMAVGPDVAQIDALAVVKASQAVSGQIVLDRLLETLMRIVIENAGAQRGCLLLENGAGLTLAVDASVDGQAISVHLPAQAPSQADLPGSLLNRVRRTRQKVILADASTPHPFATDAYFSRQHTKSALCMPVLRQAELVGLLYLENSLATHAFTPERVAVLELLASQAVISLENARLYADLQKENSERKRAEEALLESKQRFRDYAETASDWFWESGPEHELTDLSGNLDIFGNRDAIIGKRRGSLAADLESEPEKWRQHMATLERHESFRNFEYTSTDAEGRLRFLSVSGRPVFDQAGRFTGYRGTTADLTERREAEERLRQSQKMESVGQLTGGIAHDFNNILTVIMGAVESLADDVVDRRSFAATVKMIDEAATRGADLTRQLLAFARKQTLCPRPTDINALIVDTARLLRPTLGEQVEIKSMLDESAWQAMIDPTQLSTALINLALNARDAMPRGGKLRIETANVVLDEAAAHADPEAHAGPYVMIAVSDTGTGIPAALLNKVFEPFFTTKEFGKGTGLGLSMVYGFVKQSGGLVRIRSEEGHGTTIRLYLPRAEAANKASGAPTSALQGGDETILVVEDDPLTRKFVVTQLESLGYNIVSAATGAEALALVDRGVTFDLLFTDVIMPGGVNGRELAEEMAKRRPLLRILYTSGYAEDAIVHHGRLDPGIALLNKPYRKADLARQVREALGRLRAPNLNG